VLRLDAALMGEVMAHARESYPEECVGFFLGARGSDAPDEVRRCENIQNRLHAGDPAAFPRTARTAYNLGARDLLLLDKSQRGDRPVVCIYHSHIEADAYFSAEDRRFAVQEGELVYPVQYLVVSMYDGEPHAANLFRWDAVRGEFDETSVPLA
jgi:proteasome lid subunit RPN8/RPN11